MSFDLDSVDNYDNGYLSVYYSDNLQPMLVKGTESFSQLHFGRQYTLVETKTPHFASLNERTGQIFLIATGKNEIVPIRDIDGSGKIGVDMSWGGSEGTKYDFSMEVEIHDDKGNFLEGEVHQDNTGKGGAGVFAGNEFSDKNKN